MKELTGTPSQIEWAELIRPRVNAEFDRVANALSKAARNRPEQVRSDTRVMIQILEENRVEVLANERAGYFIRYWQELNDQVRQMIGRDSRYQAIKARSRSDAKDQINESRQHDYSTTV